MDDTAETASLESLLVAPGHDPVALAERLRRRREDLAKDGPLARDLDQIELAFLERRGKGAAARRAFLAYEREALGLTDERDAAALFDLAELRAAFQAAGSRAEADVILPLLQDRAQRVAIDEELVAQAKERVTTLALEQEEVPLAHGALLAAELRELLERLAARAEGASRTALRRLARRVRRAESDRVLDLRLERLLSRTGVAVLENTSLLLLLALLALLLVDAWFDFEPKTQRALELVDAWICAFFVAEFGLRLAFVPTRASWFLRHLVTDLVPALPALLLFADLDVGAADDFVALRLLRLLRLAQLARYVQALRPALRLWRALLFLVRGLDRVVHRLSPLLNRNLVFFEHGPGPVAAPAAGDAERRLLFRALRKEHVLLDRLDGRRAEPVLAERAARLVDRLMAARPRPRAARLESVASRRDIRVESVIESLQAITPDQLEAVLTPRDLRVLDRVVRVVSAPVVRHLPFFRRLAVVGVGSPEERVVGLSRRIAEQLEIWRARLVWFADLHGIVTGPQVLDRVATALMKATQRPAVRLLLFGGIFSLVRLLIGEHNAFGDFLKRFVATPLVVLGAVCFVLLLLARWLKALAGEATQALLRTSEAHFLSLLELGKLRHEQADARFLARRVLGSEGRAQALLAALRAVRDGRMVAEATAADRAELDHLTLLYLHFLDGGILHWSDTKTTEQLLANLALQDVRHQIGFAKRDWRRLRRLALDEGTVFGGPYLWFSFIVESAALETGKRILEYNRGCLSKAQRAHAGPDRLAAFARWLERRKRTQVGRRIEGVAHGRVTGDFAGFEFTALDFLASDAERDARVEDLFGAEVLEVLRKDRAAMVREIFGTRPLDRLPVSERSLNFFVLYSKRLSGGRVLMLPLFFVLWLASGIAFVVRRIGAIVREILSPEQAELLRQSGKAPFVVALRKIRRMKGPGLLEAMRTRALFDPAYGEGELEKDLDFLQVNTRDRAALRGVAARVRERVATWRASELGALARSAEADQALRTAAGCDREGMLTLLLAEPWLAGIVPGLERERPRVAWHRLLFAVLRGKGHPVARLAQRLGGRLPRSAFPGLRRLYAAGDREARRCVDTWVALPPGAEPRAEAERLVARFAADADDTRRNLLVLRAVQSLTVLDVRNYRDLVFRLGRYAEEGEDAALATALP